MSEQVKRVPMPTSETDPFGFIDLHGLSSSHSPSLPAEGSPPSSPLWPEYVTVDLRSGSHNLSCFCDYPKGCLENAGRFVG